MSINLRDYQHFTVTDLSGGVNEFASTYKVGDNELISAKNMSFKDSGGIKVRKGDILLDDDNASGITGTVQSMHRYVRNDNTRKTMLYTSNGGIWIDNDDNSFSKVPSSSEQSILSSDGRCRFTQYYDTVLFGTELDGISLYNSDVSTTDISNIEMIASYWYLEPYSISTSGGSLDSPYYYYYRFTLDYQYGDFIGESGPVHTDRHTHISMITLPGQTITGVANVVNFIRPKYTPDLPSNIPRINIYRSNKKKSADDTISTEKEEFFYIGSVSRSVFNNADIASNEIIYSDGGIAPGFLLEYNKMEIPPKPRFLTMHKGRIWMAYVSYKLGSTEAWANGQYADDEETYPHRVFISSLNNGSIYEPGVYYTDQFIDIEPKGSGITGIWSFHNDIIVVFKANSMHVIQGDNPHPDHFNLQVRTVDNNIGCIAPESICEVEGRLTWLSNSGVYYWDGGGKPKPLKTDNIVDTIQGLEDSAKSNVVSIYDKKERELLMAFSDNETHGYNRKVAKFDLRTSAWSIDEYELGFGALLSLDEPDEATKIYAGFNDATGFLALRGRLSQLNAGTSTHNSIDIDFDFQTKFYDGGIPFGDKTFVAVLFELNSPEELTLNLLCDNLMDTRTDASGGFVIPLADQDALIWNTSGADNMKWYLAGGNYENTWATQKAGSTLVMLDSRCWGKRISLIPSGSTKRPINIDSMTVFYKLREGIRQT